MGSVAGNYGISPVTLEAFQETCIVPAKEQLKIFSAIQPISSLMFSSQISKYSWYFTSYN